MSSAKNYTIDDSQWSTPALSLSPGWNMLRTNGSDEYLNATQVEEMTPILGNFWNSSISWTTSNGSSTTLSFVGTDIYAYGLSGPSQSSYIAQLDNTTIGTYTARTADTEYHHLLFSAHDLQDGVTHELTLVNAQDGASLAFDYAVVTSMAAFESPQQLASASASLLAVSSASAAAAAAASYSEALLNPNGYTPAQLASLTTVYHFHWNPPAYFVVVFASLVGCLSLVAVSIMFVRSWVKDGSWRSIGSATRERFRSRNRNRSASGAGSERGGESISEAGSKRGDGESGSYLLKYEKRRPASRVLDALRRGKISPPLHPEEGNVNVQGAECGSGTSAASSGEAQHGW